MWGGEGLLGGLPLNPALTLTPLAPKGCLPLPGQEEGDQNEQPRQPYHPRAPQPKWHQQATPRQMRQSDFKASPTLPAPVSDHEDVQDSSLHPASSVVEHSAAPELSGAAGGGGQVPATFPNFLQTRQRRTHSPPFPKYAIEFIFYDDNDDQSQVVLSPKVGQLMPQGS